MDDGTDGTILHTIAERAEQCKVAFSYCAASPALLGQAWIKSAQGNFNLWCASIKATSTSKSSLDYRLRRHADVREPICDLLQGLIVALKKCQQLAVAKLETDIDLAPNEEQAEPQNSGLNSPLSPISWEAMSNESSNPESISEDESSDPFLAEYISFVKTILRQLLHISISIRKSGNKYRFGEVDAALDEGKFETFRKHLTTVILMAYEDPEAGELTVAEKIQRASDYERLTPIQRRMVHANILRRNRIEFMTRPPLQQPEADTEGSNLAGPEHSVVNSSPGLSRPMSSITSSGPRQLSGRESAKPETHSIAATATATATATEVSSQLDIRHILATKTTSAVTGMTKIGASQAYPQCPNLRSDGSLICPYCNDVLPADYCGPKGRDRWKSHVVHDIIPYSCIMDDCDIPDEMYPTAESLQEHMLEKHSVMRWTCAYCSYGSDEIKDYNAQEWESHTAAEHGDIIPADQRAIFAQLNKQLMIGPLSCPLCQFTTETLNTKVDEHILQHLHEFALRSLPDDEGEINDPWSKKSRAASLLSHTQLNSIDAAIVREYPIATHEEIEGAMDRAQHIFSTLGITFPKPRLEMPLHSDTAAFELWYTKSCRLKEILDIPRFISHEGMHRELPNIRNEMLDVVEEMNSAAVMDAQPLSMNQTDSVQDMLVPFLPSYLNDRDDILDKLDNIFCSYQRPSQQLRMALAGPKGSGKTTIAQLFVHRMQERSEDCSIFWIDASTESSIEQSLNAISDQISSLRGRIGSTSDGLRIFPHYLTWRFNGRWLVILDGLQRSTAMFLSLQNLLPQGLKGNLLFTTSDTTSLALLGHVEIIKVPKLDNKFYEVNSSLRPPILNPEDRLIPYGCSILDITNTDLCKACISNTKAKRFYTYERGEHGETKCTASNDDDGRLFLGWSLFNLFIATGVCLIIDKLSISPQHGDKFRGLHNTWNRTFTQVFNKYSKHFKIKHLYGNPTIHELVCHFNGSLDFNHILYAPDGSPLLTAAEFLDRIPQYIKETRQNHKNVNRCVYSNANYILLALFIEEVSGQQFDIFLKENIFDPLKMNQTHMRREQLSLTTPAQQRAQPYIASSNGHRHKVPEGCLASFADSVERAVTGGYISAGDLAIFLDNIFKNLDNDDESFDVPLNNQIVNSLFTGVGTLFKDKTQFHGYTKVGMRTTLNRNFAGMHSLNRLILSGTKSSKETIGETPDGEKPLEAFYIAGCGTGWAYSVYLIPTRRVYVFALTNTTGAVDMSDIVSRMYIQQMCDLLPSTLLESGAIDQWDTDSLLKRRGEYCEHLARQMRIENMPVLHMVELQDAAMDTPNTEHANIIGRYENSKSRQVLTIVNLDDQNPDGRLGIRFTGGTKSSSLMRFIRTGERYRICSSSPGIDVLPVDRFGAWKTVEFDFNTQNGKVVSLTRQGLYLDDVFTRIG